MTRVLQIMALIAVMAFPVIAQSGRLSSDDQKEFDKAYTKWVNDTRKNDRDDIARDVHRMQEIMARNNIPANVPYDQIASTGNGFQGRSYQSRLSPQDQKEFDKYYTKWVNDTRKNDRDDVERDVRHMQDIMARNNIPVGVPYDQVASSGYASNPQYGQQPAYPQSAYPQNGQYQSRLTPEDQRDFDRYYSQWVDDSRRNDRDNADRDMQHMRDIMSRANIPLDVPVGQIATPGTALPNGYNESYSGRGAYAGQNPLSPDDQHEFDKAYSKWIKDSEKNDHDDVARDAGKMQEIMARYNIPTNVPYDQIASPNAGYRH